MAIAAMTGTWSVPAISQVTISSVPYTADCGDLLIQCGLLITGESDKPRKNMSVLIQDGLIFKAP